MFSPKPTPVSTVRLQRFASSVARWATTEASRQQDMANFEVDAYDLTGMCAIAAVRAHALLLRAGFFDAKLALSSRWMECHAFVVVAGRIVDPTVMQFKKDAPLVQEHLARKVLGIIGMPSCSQMPRLSARTLTPPNGAGGSIHGEVCSLADVGLSTLNARRSELPCFTWKKNWAESKELWPQPPARFSG